MTADHFNATLTTFQEHTPFRPFTVVMISGRRFQVDHAQAFIFRAGVAVFVSPGGAPIIFDHEGVEHFVAELEGSVEA